MKTSKQAGGVILRRFWNENPLDHLPLYDGTDKTLKAYMPYSVLTRKYTNLQLVPGLPANEVFQIVLSQMGWVKGNIRVGCVRNAAYSVSQVNGLHEYNWSVYNNMNDATNYSNYHLILKLRPSITGWKFQISSLDGKFIENVSVFFLPDKMGYRPFFWDNDSTVAEKSQNVAREVVPSTSRSRTALTEESQNVAREVVPPTSRSRTAYRLPPERRV